jgi:catechol 2,3-dioxygenase-like lactoylglutathione lyase family enzyme
LQPPWCEDSTDNRRIAMIETTKIDTSKAYSSFATKDVDRARTFYADKLGISAESLYDGQLLELRLRDGLRVLVYPKDDFQPATYTVLNFPVPDIDRAVDALTQSGISFDRYEGFDQDEKGIARSDGNGPDIAWFKDPDGNILAVHTDEPPPA